MSYVIRVMHHPSRPVPAWASEIGAEVFSDHDSNGPWWNARRCWASPTQADHIVVLHDDAVLSPGFLISLQKAIASRPKDIISLFSTRPELLEAKKTRCQWVAYDVFCWGLGLVLPTNIARGFVNWCDDHIREDWKADDTRVTLYACATERSIFCTAPSLLQHNPGGHGVSGKNDCSPWVAECAVHFDVGVVQTLPVSIITRENFLISRKAKFKA